MDSRKTLFNITRTNFKIIESNETVFNSALPVFVVLLVFKSTHIETKHCFYPHRRFGLY